MIYKNEDGIRILEFGTGDIEVANGFVHNSDETCVLFTAQKPDNIGEVSQQALEKYGEKAVVRTDGHTMFVFTDPKSIDVIIDQLTQAKNNLSCYESSSCKPKIEE